MIKIQVIKFTNRKVGSKSARKITIHVFMLLWLLFDQYHSIEDQIQNPSVPIEEEQDLQA